MLEGSDCRCARALLSLSLLLAVLLTAQASGAAGSRASAPPRSQTPSRSWSAKFKAEIRANAAEPLARQAFRTAPLMAWLAGWDFSKARWRTNEFTNQLVHLMIGGLTNRLFGARITLCVAVGVELWQFLANDACAPKLMDRTRDVAFYLLG